MAVVLTIEQVVSPWAPDWVGAIAESVWAAALPGSVFIRAGRANVPIVYDAGRTFEIGKSIELIPGGDITVIAHGLLVAEAIRASEALAAEGVNVRVIDMHTIKPLDAEAIAEVNAAVAFAEAGTWEPVADLARDVITPAGATT